jgi:hypothetical protein
MFDPELAQWWRDLTTPPLEAGGALLRTLILIPTSPTDVTNFKADLPAHVLSNLHEMYNTPPAPAYPTIVFGSFDAQIGSLFTLFAPSRLLRVAVVPETEEVDAALFAAHQKYPPLVVRGWPPGTGAAIAEQLETARRSNIPEAFLQWSSVKGRQTALVLAGTATHHLAEMLQRAKHGWWTTSLSTFITALHSGESRFRLQGKEVLFLWTSFDQALDPSLAGTGYQSALRSFVLDHPRTVDVVILCGDDDPAKFRKLNHPRHQSFF